MKTDETIAIEKAIAAETSKMGVFGCHEVTIGWFGKERVDYMTYDTKGIWRCYEIKVSKADFRSKAHNTFLGHYNYYVMPRALYEEVQAEIPDHIGVFVFYGKNVGLVKRPKRQNLGIDEQTLKNSLIRSLARDAEKLRKVDNPDFVERMNRQLVESNKQKDHWQSQYYKVKNDLYNITHKGEQVL